MKRNSPHGTLQAHLFTDEAVSDADAEHDTPDQPVESLCTVSKSYGPFTDIDYPTALDATDDDLCGRCVARWRARKADESDDDASHAEWHPASQDARGDAHDDANAGGDDA